MLEVVASQELKEDLSSVEASIKDLISAEEFFSMVGPTFEFGESLVTAEDIAEMVKAGFLRKARRRLLLLVRLFLFSSQDTLLSSRIISLAAFDFPLWVPSLSYGGVPIDAASFHPQWDSNSQQVLLGL